MPRRRIVLKNEVAVYHVVNRLVRKEFWLDEEAREVFVHMLRKQARFTGVEVLTYCVMSNHFHLLLRVPPSVLNAHKRGESPVDDALLLERYRDFYGKRKPLDFYSADELERILQSGGHLAEAARQRVLARMGDLSVFMQELKHRFMIWFNRTRKNEGTIWSAKFKSVLVENTVEVRTAVAAYIDLNPVRARITDDPETYRCSGFGAAVRERSEAARQGLRHLFSDTSLASETWQATLHLYRRMLFSIGLRSCERGDGSNTGTVNPAKAEAILSEPEWSEKKALFVGNLATVSELPGKVLQSARILGCYSFVRRFLDDSDTGKKHHDHPRNISRGEREAFFSLGRCRNH